MLIWGITKVASLLCNSWCFLIAQCDCVTCKPRRIHVSTQNPARRTPVHCLSASKWQKLQVPKSSHGVFSATRWLSVFQAVIFPKWRCGTSWLKRVVWKGSTIGLGLCWSKQTVAVFWHVAPHPHLPCSPKTETDSVQTSVAAPQSSSWDRSSRLLLSPCSFQTSAPPYPAFLSAVWLWVWLSWPQTCLCICNHSFVCVHSWKGNTETSTGTCSSHWLWRKAVCICLLGFFIMQPKLYWQGWDDCLCGTVCLKILCCKTRRSKALKKNVFAVLFTRVSKAFVKMLLCWT